MKRQLLVLFLFASLHCFSQPFEDGFEFGKVTYRELEMKECAFDTAASAVVLDEFAKAYIDNSGDHNLLMEYHVKIKILKKQGLQFANIEVPLRKQEGRTEMLSSVKASAFNIENGSIREMKVENKGIYTENLGKYLDLKKFAIPNVREGSVIEIQYMIESPFIRNFRQWDFQSDIPKVKSEFWAIIPGNYIYNITLKGFLKLDKNENELVRDCFTPGGGHRADCLRYKFAMQNIPAFTEEDYMTAKSNFLSSVHFELSEIRYFDGRVDKITKEWKDAEEELRRDEHFGLQIKRGKDIVDTQVEQLISGETDELAKAKKIYEFIKEWYRWDEVRGKYSEFGIKKAFEKKTGNVGDINLSLIAALKYARLNVEPVILSTRDNGLPIELYPVLTDFNYVIAKINIDGKVYLADATDDFHPFGVLPEHCLNGKGRVLGEKESYWIELKPAQRGRHLRKFKGKLDKDGIIRGSFENTYTGYEAVNLRKKIYSFSNEEDYIQDLKKRLDKVDLKNVVLENVDSLDKPLIQKFDVEIHAFDDMNASTLLFNPFMFERWKENPFKSRERLYPVDFGTPLEQTTFFDLEIPSNYEVIDLPEKVALTLPNAGGRYIVEVKNSNQLVQVMHSLHITKTVFTSEEYHYLKELFNRILHMQNTELLFKRKAG